ncbi:hypothetical protein [Streptomyces sp. XY152]|uniref:hypothetical protein n=1 Tax=Streptomyces sp. XY152 TaxID=1415560 RepID=UPI00131A6CD1|nr:hypothetical protein [Streptomyces sp. XY152]
MKRTNKSDTRKSGNNCSMAWIPVFTTTLLGFSASACSDGEQEAPHLTATQVCDSTLDTSAAEALERMGATEKFGETYRDSPEGFSLTRAAQTLHADVPQRNSCYVYKLDDHTGRPLIDVEFFAIDRYMKPDHSPDKGDTENKFYPIGLYAKTHGTESATLYFKCSTQGGGNETPYVKATLFSASGEVSPKATGQDLMTILGTMSRALAKQVGCASEAALPAQITEAAQSSG